MSDAGAQTCNIPCKGKKLIESERKSSLLKVENIILQYDPWYCLLSTKNNSQPWLNKSDGAQTEVFRWKWPKMSISKLSLALKRMRSFLSSFFSKLSDNPIPWDHYRVIFEVLYSWGVSSNWIKLVPECSNLYCNIPLLLILFLIN